MIGGDGLSLRINALDGTAPGSKRSPAEPVSRIAATVLLPIDAPMEYLAWLKLGLPLLMA